MNRHLLLLFLLLPIAVFSQVPGNKPSVPDTVKPKKNNLPVDTSEFWRDSLFKDGDPKIWRDGEVQRQPKPPRKRRKFKIRFSDRVQYSLLGDYPLTVASGVPTTLVLQKKLTAWEDSIIPIKYRGDTTLSEHRRSVLLRAGRILLIDAPIETLVMALGQDFYGHYGRMREFGFEGASVKFGAPIPFWRPMNNLAYDRPVIEELGSRQEIAMVAGGALEYNSMASNEISTRWMQRKSLYYREALHFLRLQTAAITSVLTATNDQSNRVSAVDDWLFYTNRTYGFYSSYGYTANDLKKDYVIAALTNPWLYTSMYSVFGQFLFNGKDSLNIPAIKLGYGKALMPWVRFGFSPFGGEWIPEISVTKHRQVLNVYARIGNNAFNQNYGGGIKLINFRRSTKLSLNAHLTYWNQKYFYRGYGNQVTEPIGFGGAATVSGFYKVSKAWNHSLSVVFTAGYKTRGYMEGEVWDASPILRAGISFNLDKDFEQDDTVPEYEYIPNKLTKKERKREKAKIAKARKAAQKKYKR